MATILIVDSSIVNQQFLCALLKSCGHQLLEAHNGIEALEMTRASRPDLVISEVLMLTMDGYEFAKELRASPATALTPVIFYVAACYEQEARLAAAEYGIAHILTKPAEPEMILSTVNAALSIQSLDRSAEDLARFARHQMTSPSDPINPEGTVFVVDDDPGMGRLLATIMAGAGLKSTLYSSAEEFLADYHDDPGCLVVDLLMPQMSGLELLQSLRARRMQIPAIILTAGGDIASVRTAMRLRALDFMEKPVNHHTLLARVYLALQEDSIRRQRRARAEMIRIRMDTLTDRENELVELLLNGSSSKEIAAKLSISIRTVANHRSHMLAKTGAANVADLVRMTMIAHDARAQSWDEPEPAQS